MNRKWIFLVILVIIFIFTAPLFIYSCKKDSKSNNPIVPKDFGLPIVYTLPVSFIASTSAICGGIVYSEGASPITSRGVCWSANQYPTNSGNKTTDGNGMGNFTSSLTGLFANATYSVMAYATNSHGTSYGSIQTFTTSSPQMQSFFPIAVWLQNPLNTAEGYKNIGINTFVGLWNDLDQPQLDAIKNNNLKVICAQNSFGLTVTDESAIIGWMHGDEPDNECINPGTITDEYYGIKHNDPTRPVYLNLGQRVANYGYIGGCNGFAESAYLAGCDIASFDIYPVNSIYSTVQNNLWYVALGIQNLIAWSGNKPTWCWIESTRIADTSPRKPTTSEVKSEVWMAIIHGASGFGYFCHSFVNGATDEAAMLHDGEMCDAIRVINLQVTSLAVVLNSSSTTGYASVTLDNSSTPVDIMTKNYGDANYLFAIAMSDGQANATFTVSSGTNAEVMGEGRTIPIVNGKFSDMFLAYTVHLYKISN